MFANLYSIIEYFAIYSKDTNMEELKKTPPPGKRWWKNISFKAKWLITAVIGLLLINFGLWNLVEANTLKLTHVSAQIWAAWAVYGFIITSIGLIIFGQSILYKVMIINKKYYKKAMKESSNSLMKQRKKTKKHTGPLP